MNTQTICTIINKIVSALALPCLGVGGGAQGDKGMGPLQDPVLSVKDLSQSHTKGVGSKVFQGVNYGWAEFWR